MAFPTRHLTRRPVLLWALTLLWIAFFLGLLGWIFWNVRMRVTWPVAFRFESSDGGLLLRTTLPSRPYLSIRRGDQAEVVLESGPRLEGRVVSVAEGPASVALSISCRDSADSTSRSPLEGEPMGTITLRALRMVSAFGRHAARVQRP